MVVPEIDIDGILWSGQLAPQLARGEAHRVKVLRLLTEEVGVAVGEDEHPMIARDRSGLSSRVSRQPCVSGGIDVVRANALAHSEPRRDLQIPAGGHAVGDEPGYLVCGERWSRLLRAARRLAAVDLRTRDESALDEQFNHPDQELLV